MEIRSFSAIGMRRRQEDAYTVIEMPEKGRTLLAVADGMGGHGYGDEASACVVRALSEYWLAHPDQSDSEAKIVRAIEEVGKAYEANARGREMGSTLVMASIEGNQAYIAHCGDSRIYVWRKATHQRFHTDDHKVLTPEGWEFVANAFFTGMCHTVKPEIRRIELQEGDRLMLCSDGVSNYVPAAELWMALTQDGGIDKVARDIESYCRETAGDNYTAILFSY